MKIPHLLNWNSPRDKLRSASTAVLLFVVLVLFVEGMGQWILAKVAEHYHLDEVALAWLDGHIGRFAMWSDIILQSRLLWLAVGFCAALWMVRYIPGKSHSVAEEADSEKWLLPHEAAERFAPDGEAQIWKEDPRYLHAELLAGGLVGRGRPHYGSAGDPPAVINRSEWQTLRLAGRGFCAAASSVGPAHSYDNVEIAGIDR
jgi:hypothetical protein